MRAWSPDISENTIFTATGTAPVYALQSAVYDQNYNRMVVTPVRYRILSGAARFAGLPLSSYKFRNTLTAALISGTAASAITIQQGVFTRCRGAPECAHSLHDVNDVWRFFKFLACCFLRLIKYVIRRKALNAVRQSRDIIASGNRRLSGESDKAINAV